MAKNRSKRNEYTKTELLDRFSSSDLRVWGKYNKLLQEYEYKIFYCFEAQRAANSNELQQALLQVSPVKLKINGWARIVNYSYSLSPLSSAGSITNIGGRFNFGKEINPIQYAPFNGLYIAEDVETAWREKFGVTKNGKSEGLEGAEFALAEKQSITVLSLKGKIYNLFDLQNLYNLKSFMNVMSDFKVSDDIRKLERELKEEKKLKDLKPTKVIKTERDLRDSFMVKNWRERPQQYSVPSNSQIFGKLVYSSGFDGIVYRSTKGKNRCIVIFPKNLENSASFLEIKDKTPPGVEYTRLSSDTCFYLI